MIVSVLSTLLRVLLISILVLSISTTVWLCWYNWRYRKILKEARKLPTGSPIYPVIGHVYLLTYGHKWFIEHFIRKTKKMAKQKISKACLWFGPYPVFFVFSADDIQTVITKSKVEKSMEYHLMKVVLGNGLLTAPGHIQKKTRKFVNPLFQPRNLEQLMPVFNKSSHQLVIDLSQHVAQGQVELSHIVAPVAFRNIANVIFGPDIDIDVKSTEFQGLIRMVKGAGRVMIHRFSKIWLRPDAVFKFFWKEEIDKIHGYWTSFAKGPLKQLQYKEKERKMKSNHKRVDLKQADAKFPTLPDAYRELRYLHPEFTQKDENYEMMTLITAGGDTTTIAISSCLLSLAAYPDIQDRLYREIVSVAGAEDKEVTVQELNNMPYLDQVFKETLRKYSVLPFILRTALEDIKLSDCVIHAGATIGLSILAMHFDSSIYPDPEVFDPERFSPERVSGLKKHQYMPFSVGGRNCIGGQYATMLAKTTVIHVIRRFRLHTSVDTTKLKFKIGIAMIADEGYPVEIYDRKSGEVAMKN